MRKAVTNENPMKKNGRFYCSIILTVMEGLLSGSNFILLYAVMKSVFSGHLDIKEIGTLTVLLTGIFLLRLIVYSTGYVQGQIGGAAVSKQIRLFLGDKLKRIPLSRFTQGQIGQYVNTMTSDVGNYEKILTHKTGDLIKNITLCVMMVVFVGTLWMPAGLILLVAILLLVPAMGLTFRAVRKYGTRKNQICAESVSSIVEYVNGIQTLRAYGMGGVKNQTTTRAMKDYSDISYIYEAKIIPIGAGFSILCWCSLPLIMWTASGPWLAGSLDTVSYLLICMLPLFMAKLCGTLFVDLTSYKNLMISKNNITKIMEEQEEPEEQVGFALENHEISFDHVSFSYVPGEPVLKDMTFTAPDQKLTAIVGDSGSGKSTILNLIARYYDPDGGQITIGGVGNTQVSARWVHAQISMVDQDVFLFDDTIRENIRHARPEAKEEEVEVACRKANCDDFIRCMEKGYDTPIGENGILLSGGERQRLSIARAILKNSPVLLLDEATASLDIENELAVKQAIVNLLKERKTVIMIAHTLSIVKHADQILVVADGRIAESGTHEELLEKNGKYAAMWQAEQELLSLKN